MKLEAWGQGTKKKEERRKVKDAGGTESQGNVSLVQTALKMLNCRTEQMMWTTSMQRIPLQDFQQIRKLPTLSSFPCSLLPS